MFNNTQVIPPVIVTLGWEQDIFPKQLNPHTKEFLLGILKEKLARLVNQDSCGLKKKFFNGKVVYTIKLTNDDRVLFNQVKTKVTGGETLLVVEEMVINHDYQKAVTLRGAFRSDSVDWASLNHLTELESVGYSCYKSKLLTALSVEALMEQGGENNVYFKKAWRSLTVVQQSIYTQPLPLFISGPPGSGKTMVSLALLQQRAVMHQTSGEGEVTYLYLTKSTFLCKEMAEQWREWSSMNLKASLQPVKVMFLTPEKLLVSSVLSDEEVSRCEGIEECMTYLRNTRGASSRDINLVYQELLLASAQLNQDESKRYSDSVYSTYGMRQSLLSTVDREWAFNVYRSYQQHLKSEKRVHIPFYHNSRFSEHLVDDKLKFDLVIADESQDISTQLLVWASLFARNDAVVFCMDNHQNLSSPLSNAVFLKQYFHDLKVKLNETHYTASHRTPAVITRVLSEWIKLKLLLIGGRREDEYTEIEGLREIDASAMANKIWLNTYTEQHQTYGHSSEFAVVIFEETQRAAAKTHYETPLVFMPHEIKGLEFSYVLLYRPMNHDGSDVTINLEMKKKQKEGVDFFAPLTISPHHSKQKEGLANAASMVAWLNDRFVALSRVTSCILVFQDTIDEHKTGLFHDWFRLQITGDRPSLAADVNMTKSDSHDWALLAKELSLRGKPEQATGILRDKLGWNEEQIQSWYRENGLMPVISKPAAIVSEMRQVTHQPAPLVVVPQTASNEPMPILPVPQPTVPLLKKLTDAAAYFYNNVDSKKNIESVINSKHAKWMLFGHNSFDMKTVFENLLISKKIVLVHKHIDRDKALKDKYMLLLHEAMKDWRMLSFLVGSLEGCNYLSLHWADLKSSILNQLERIYARKPIGEAEPFYDEMVLSNDYRSLLPDREDIKNELSEALLTQEINEGTGVNLFSLFTVTEIGVGILNKYWTDFKKQLTEKCISQRINLREFKGTTPFFWLAGSPSGRALLQKYWVDFKPYMSKKLVCHEVEAGEHKGKSAFHFLTAEQGTSHLTAYWDDFKVYLSPELLLQAAERGEEKGKPNFYYFAGRPGGRKILDDHWDDFKGLISEKMLGQIAEEGEFKGINSFYWLTAYVDGISLLMKYWADFRPHLSRKILFQVAQEGANKSLFPFYVLTFIPKGIALINQHWDDLKKYIPANILTMNIINELGGRESLQESLKKTCFGLDVLERIKTHLASMPSEPLRSMSVFQPNFTDSRLEQASTLTNTK